MFVVIAVRVVFSADVLLAILAALTLELRMRPDAGTHPAGNLVLRSAADSAIVRTIAIDRPAIRVAEEAGTRWIASLAAPGWWAAETEIVIGAERVTLDVWRAGRVSFELTTAEKDLALPTEVALLVESPPTPRPQNGIARDTRLPCTRTSDARWSCDVPATPIDVVLRVPGATPHYRWDVRPEAGKTKSLGTFALRRGASVVASLDAETVKRLDKPARARLLRPVADAASQTAARLSVPVAEAAFDARGWVQLAPAPAGTYVLDVSAPGFAPAQIAPVEVYEGKESTLPRGIELFPPLEVTFSVEPATDGDKAWDVEWSRQPDFTASGAMTAPVRKRVGTDGRVTFEGQAPGTYIATVLDAAGNRVWTDSFAVTNAAQAHFTATLKLHKIEGTVSLGEEPLAATLWFGSSDGAVRSRLESDEEGEFEGRLPSDGQWAVEIINASRGVRAIVPVEVKDTPLQIRLPDTTVSGRVVNADGERVTRGRVVVFASGRAFSEQLTAEGTFAFRGLAAARVSLVATDATTGDSSPSTDLQLREGAVVRDVELRTAGSRRVSGAVTSSGVPAVGARVTALPADPSGPRTSRNAITDLHGRFTIPVPSATRRASFIVAAPNRTLQPFDVVLTDEPIALDVAAIGGVVVLHANSRFTLARNGIDLPIQQLFEWIMAHGIPLTDTKALRIPGLAPGHYRACNDAAYCVEGTLAPRATLELRVISE